jgi:phage shock protein PspC (stress-responsive transcriptional regulator)
MNKKLYRDEYHKVFGGVCSGLADYFDMDVTVVRLLFAFTFFIMGVGFVPYIILWIVLPKKEYNFPGYSNPTVDYTVPPQPTADPYTPPPFQERSTNPGPDFYTPPAGNMPPVRQSNAGVIFGFVLIIIGGIILANEYDLIPYLDWDRLWPIVLVIVGGAIIASGQKKQPWEKQNWQNNNAGNTRKGEQGNTDTTTTTN